MVTHVPPALRALASAQHGLLSAAQADRHGVAANVRRRLCEHGRWGRVVRGVYDTAPGATWDWPTRRRRTALIGLLRYGPDAVAVGASALALYGAQGLPGWIVPEVSVRGVQPRAPLRRERRDARPWPANEVRISVRQFDVGAEVRRIEGFRVVNPEWALAQAVPELPRRHAVAVMDSLVQQGVIDAAGLARAHRLARGRRGVARTHPWWSQADGRAESVLETYARLECTDHGIPPDDLQVVIRDRHGAFIARGDLGWRRKDGRWLIAEMDGREYHEALPALLRDRSRQNEMLLRGEVQVLRFTWSDTRRDGYIARTVRSALQMRPG